MNVDPPQTNKRYSSNCSELNELQLYELVSFQNIYQMNSPYVIFKPIIVIHLCFHIFNDTVVQSKCTSVSNCCNFAADTH